MMKVELAKLRPNPHRDFGIDPIDPETVQKLVESIDQDGFWGGVVCRKTNHGIEIAAGHHRIQAALQVGITTADLFVGKLDDRAMIRIYATENATQRGTSGTALAGSIASAIRFLAKAILIGDKSLSQIYDSEHSMEKSREALISDKGIGARVIERFLTGTPGINESTITAQLANLKASGNYGRIIREVTREIEDDKREALAELKRLEEEAAQAKIEAEKAEERRKAAEREAKKKQAEADRKAAEAERERIRAESEFAAKHQAELEKELEHFESLKATRDTARRAVESVNGKPITFDFEGVAKEGLILSRNSNQSA